MRNRKKTSFETGKREIKQGRRDGRKQNKKVGREGKWRTVGRSKGRKVKKMKEGREEAKEKKEELGRRMKEGYSVATEKRKEKVGINAHSTRASFSEIKKLD